LFQSGARVFSWMMIHRKFTLSTSRTFCDIQLQQFCWIPDSYPLTKCRSSWDTCTYRPLKFMRRRACGRSARTISGRWEATRQRESLTGSSTLRSPLLGQNFGLRSLRAYIKELLVV
jgi:hypothetical protein